MWSFIRRILRFDFLGRKERAENVAQELRRLEKEGKIEIYEIYENGEWDFAWKKIDKKEGKGGEPFNF